MQEERDIYEWKSEKMLEYHKRQIKKPYRSTVAFEKFLIQHTELRDQSILDVACGMGGDTLFSRAVSYQQVFRGGFKRGF